MYNELDLSEQIRIAVEFVARDKAIPKELRDTLGENLTALIENPLGEL
tara:strand:+ start:270 stop:413 length:144 start_codon:yes stop_codon:yes gene_type:complete